MTTLGIIILTLWGIAGVVGTLFRDDLREDAAIQSGLFPVFSWIGLMTGGILLGPLALASGISRLLERRRD